MQGIRLEEQALQIQLAQQLFEHSPFMVFPGGIARLADRQAQRRRVARYLGNKRRLATCCGFDRAAQGSTIEDELVETLCANGDSGDSPIMDGCAEGRDTHLVEEGAEG